MVYPCVKIYEIGQQLNKEEGRQAAVNGREENKGCSTP